MNPNVKIDALTRMTSRVRNAIDDALAVGITPDEVKASIAQYYPGMFDGAPSETSDLEKAARIIAAGLIIGGYGATSGGAQPERIKFWLDNSLTGIKA
jgi:hypothetical protein